MADTYKSIVELWPEVQAPAAPPLKDVILDPKTTALLMLDFVKQACTDEIRPRCRQTLPAARRLLDAARASNVLVVYSIGSVTPGRTIADTLPEVAPLPGEPYVQAGPNKFLHSDLDDILKQRGIKTVIVTGTAAHGCIIHTADESVFRGYKVVVPVDCISAESLYIEQYVVHHFTIGSRVGVATTLSSAERIKFA
jgi:nicotinamidase-related amidase